MAKKCRRQNDQGDIGAQRNRLSSATKGNFTGLGLAPPQPDRGTQRHTRHAWYVDESDPLDSC